MYHRKAGPCPDCGQIAFQRIQIIAAGLPVWVCPTCGTAHEDWSWFREVGEEEAKAIIETREPEGLFLFDTGIEVIGIDNLTGDAWVEEFPDRRECLEWLAKYREVVR